MSQLDILELQVIGVNGETELLTRVDLIPSTLAFAGEPNSSVGLAPLGVPHGTAMTQF